MTDDPNPPLEIRCAGCGVEPSDLGEFAAFAVEGWSILCPECSADPESATPGPDRVRSLGDLMSSGLRPERKTRPSKGPRGSRRRRGDA